MTVRIAGLTMLAAALAGATGAVGESDPGVYEDRVVFGQSAALSGPARELGRA